MTRAAALAAVLLMWLLAGPWVLVLAVAGLAVPRVRAWVTPARSPRRSLGIGALAAVLVAGVVLVLPDGWLPIPPGPGRWVTPEYVGRPAIVRPLTGLEAPRHPHLAGVTGTAEGGAWATNATPWPGPVGDRPEVDTAWHGTEGCGTLTVDSRGRLVTLCGAGAELRLLDPESLRPVVTKELAEPADAVDGPPCGNAVFLDDRGRAVVATADLRVLAVATADGEGQADLTVVESHDLSRAAGPGDCVVGLLPDRDGRIWFATRGGVVGTVDPGSGRIRASELGEGVGNALAADERGGVYAVSTGALYRFEAGADGRPRVSWRRQYDGGSRRKPGQLDQGSGTPPALLPGGLVAIADNADPRMHVVFLRRDSGEEVCEVPVFDEEEGATETSLTAVGSGVVVVNGHGYRGPRSTALGLTTTPGLARVDVSGSECRTVWVNTDLSVPSSGAEASLATGLLHVWAKRSSWWGASAWYLSAVDAHTGRQVFAVRAGTGTLLDNNRAGVTLAPDGSAYVPTLGGLVRVRDRPHVRPTGS